MTNTESFRVKYHRTKSDGNYGSVSCGVEEEFTLDAKDDLLEVRAAKLKEHKEYVDGIVDAILKQEAPAPSAPATESHAGMLESTSKTFPVETISVNVYNGKKYAKAKGGNFAQYGVNVWPEVLGQPPLELDLDELDHAEYPVQAGVTAIYVEKPHKDDPNKMVPDKVIGWA